MSTVAPQVTSIARAHAGSLKMAVVSSGPRYMVQRLLTQARLDTLFDVVARPAPPRPSLRQRPRPRGPRGPGCPFCAMKHGPQAHKLHRPVLCAALSPCSRSVLASCRGFCNCC